MIFWFSGTGNSYAAAKTLGEELNEPLIDMAAAIRSGHLNFCVHENELVGFVFPVYYCGLPSVVDKFIEIMNLGGDSSPKIFAVLTYGGSAGEADKLLEKALAARGCALYSAFSLLMPDNYVLLSAIDNEAKQQKALATSKAKLAIISAKIKQDWKCAIKHTPIDAAMTRMAQPLYQNGRRTKKFYADDNCIGCGLCTGVCPVEAIHMDLGEPMWTKPRCVFCLACINRCPQGAIQYGAGSKKHKRYVHPIYQSK